MRRVGHVWPITELFKNERNGTRDQTALFVAIHTTGNRVGLTTTGLAYIGGGGGGAGDGGGSEDGGGDGSRCEREGAG